MSQIIYPIVVFIFLMPWIVLVVVCRSRWEKKLELEARQALEEFDKQALADGLARGYEPVLFSEYYISYISTVHPAIYKYYIENMTVANERRFQEAYKHNDIV
jgi:hypothetical protein